MKKIKKLLTNIKNFITQLVKYRLLFIFLLCISLAITVSSFLLFYPSYNTESKVIKFTIQKGNSLIDTTKILREKKLLQSSTLLLIVAKVLQKERGIKEGIYIIDKPISLLGILNLLEKGIGEIVKITIREGLNAREIFKILRESKLKNKGNYDSFFHNKEFMMKNSLPKEVTSLEGFLFPDTYFFSHNTSEEKLLSFLIKNFFQNITPQIKKDIQESKYNFYDIIKLASIIEKETSAPSDAGLIASVFHNRLERGMRLQADPTVIYGIKNFNGNLTRKHLRQPHPHNTYTQKGLPLTPISNPGLMAIKHAINPLKSDYLYFVAKGNGYTHFSKTLKEHNRAVFRYQKQRKARKNYRSAVQ